MPVIATTTNTAQYRALVNSRLTTASTRDKREETIRNHGLPDIKRTGTIVIMRGCRLTLPNR